MTHDELSHLRSSARASGASATGFELTERALAELLHERSRASLERWLEAPLAALGQLESRDELDTDMASELRGGFTAALELFAVLKQEGQLLLGAATQERSPR